MLNLRWRWKKEPAHGLLHCAW